MPPLTARRGPDFFIIGAMKAGTTALHKYLCQHPDVLPPSRKELHYYDREIHSGWSIGTYIDQFPDRTAAQLSFDSTPVTMRLPNGARRLQADFPDIRLIAILRNPVDRAYSHYIQRAIKKKERRSFDEAIRAELAYTSEWWSEQAGPEAPEPLDEDIDSYLARGRYAEQLLPWFDAFPKDRIKIVFSDQLRNDRAATMAEICAFLGLSDWSFRLGQEPHSRRYEPMPEQTRAWLETYFKPFDDALADLLGRNLPWRSAI